MIVAGGIFLLRGLREPSVSESPAPERTVAVATPPPAPVYLLALDKPDLKVSPAALTYRSAAAENPLLADLKPAFDAFRAGDYATANREFAALGPRYPKSVEVFFYQGVARLFLADAPGAIASLTTAGKIADSAFAWDIEWYRAVAEERAGNLGGGTGAARSSVPAGGHPRAQGLRRRQGTPRRQVSTWRSPARDVCRPRRRCCWSSALLGVAATRPSPSELRRASAPQQTPVAAPVTASDIDALIGEAEGLLARRKPSDAKAVFDRALAGARRLSLERPGRGVTLRHRHAPCARSRSIKPAHDSALQCLEIYSRIGFHCRRGTRQPDAVGRRPISWAACRRRARAPSRRLRRTKPWAMRARRAIATLQVIRVNPRTAETVALYAKVVDVRGRGRRSGPRGLGAPFVGRLPLQCRRARSLPFHARARGRRLRGRRQPRWRSARCSTASAACIARTAGSTKRSRSR